MRRGESITKNTKKVEKNIIKELKKNADLEWTRHFDLCSKNDVWANLNATLTDIKAFELSWKLRWMEKQLDSYITKN